MLLWKINELMKMNCAYSEGKYRIAKSLVECDVEVKVFFRLACNFEVVQLETLALIRIKRSEFRTYNPNHEP